MNLELLDYYDEKNEKKLGVGNREYVHLNNLWHREIAVWVMNEENELLLQRRSSKKKQGANKFSITAGHVNIDDNEINVALREVSEELGLICNDTELIYLDTYKNLQENNNCFSYTYLLRTRKKITDMNMQEDEVSELRYISISELEERIRKLDEEITFVKKPHVKLAIDKIKENLHNVDF